MTKSNFILIFLLITSTILQAQYDIDWVRRYGGQDTENLRDIVVTRDGDYLVAGYTQSNSIGSIDGPDLDANVYMVLVSSEGDRIWERVYGGSDHDFANSVIEVDDGFILVGYTLSDDGDISVLKGTNDIWVVKLDYLGEIVWEKTFGGKLFDNAQDIIPTRDGGYMIIGGSNSIDAVWSNNGDGDIVLIKITAEGDVEWTNSYGSELGEAGSRVLQNDNGDFVLAAISDSNTLGPFGVPFSDILLLKVSESGELIWQRKFNAAVNFIDLKFLFEYSGGYLLGGVKSRNGFVAFLDLDGSIKWERVVGAGGVEEVNDVVITEEGNLFGVGSTTSDTVGVQVVESNILLFELDSEGAQLWLDVYENNSQYGAMSIEATSDQGYVLATRARGTQFDIFDNQDVTLMKLFLNTSATSSLDPTSTLRLYPNPATDRILVKVKQENIGSKFQIYNSAGAICVKGSIENLETEVNIISLPAGEYYFQIYEDRGAEKTFFVKL